MKFRLGVWEGLDFFQVTFWLQLCLGTQTKVSQEDIDLNFASLPCYNSNSRLEENLTKLICRKFQYRAQRKVSEIQMCPKFELESRKQFIPLNFVETQLGTGSNTSQSCVKCVRIRKFSGPHFSRIFPHSNWIRRDTRKNADQNNTEYGLVLRSEN